MITTKADCLIRSLIEAGILLTDFSKLANKVLRLQREFQNDLQDQRKRDSLREKERLDQKMQFEKQMKEYEERRQRGLAKLRDIGYVTNDEIYLTTTQQEQSQTSTKEFTDFPSIDLQTTLLNHVDRMNSPYSKAINDMQLKQRECCVMFNIDRDLRLNQEALDKACKRAKRNIYQVCTFLAARIF